ncbi:MAG: GLPGLI family protein [Chitinophagaceae bacterium]|nr:GLPGLI family protein [Chitinophagaceae bacterium]
MKQILSTFIVCFLSLTLAAQPQFIKAGKITYERKLNVWANIQGDFAEQFKKANPQFKTDLFTLEFNQNQSLYSPANNQQKNIFDLVATNNIVYSDFKAGTYTSTKNVFEKTFLINDSLKNLNWKIKNDFREIAGFNCRRATTILFDSVFVVAFYTDEIVLPGGPESFHGLPGTILGLVINRLHTTWYATKVEIGDSKNEKIIPPAKGTKVNNSQLKKQIESFFTQWGSNTQRFQWSIFI